MRIRNPGPQDLEKQDQQLQDAEPKTNELTLNLICFIYIIFFICSICFIKPMIISVLKAKILF